MIGTYCYCQEPPGVERVLGLTHYYQFEYYNVHFNNTYIVTDVCPSKELDYEGICVPKFAGLGEASLSGVDILSDHTMETQCRNWREDEGKLKIDHRFCYEPHFHHDTDYVWFNGQKRNLGRDGHQGPIAQDAEDVCEDMCQVYLGTGTLREYVFF